MVTDSILRSYQIYTHTSMVPFPVTPPGPLLDDYPNAAVAYSFRKLRTAYSGSAVRIRRSSDNAEANIGFSGTDFDTAAAAAHIGGGSGFIVTWYDQGTNGINVTQSTAGSQPAYTASGLGSLPCMTHSGSSLLASAAIDLANLSSNSITTTVTVFDVLRFDSTGDDFQIPFCWPTGSSSPRVAIFVSSIASKTVRWDFPNGASFTSGTASTIANVPLIWESFRDVSDNQTTLLNGSFVMSDSISADLSSGTTAVLNVGNYDGSAFPHKGYQSELIIWAPDLGSSGRTAVRTHQNSYYGVF